MSITITMEPKEVEHFLVCICFSVACATIAYLIYHFHKNNK